MNNDYNYFSGVLNGVKVWGKITDPSRPTSGRIMSDAFENKLVINSDLENGFTFHKKGINALRKAKN